MPEVVTLGEAMVLFVPRDSGSLKYVSEFRKRYAGAESNFATGLKKLGHSTGWISKVGDDVFGEYIIKEISGEGVDTSRVVMDPKHPTGVMFKQINEGEETTVMYYRKGSAASTLVPEDIDEDYIRSAKVVHITGITPALSEDCARATKHIVEVAKKDGVLVSFDPNIRLRLWSKEKARETLLPILKMSDIVLMGLDEAEILLGTRDVDSIIAQLRGFGAQAMAIKLGSKGAVVADRGDQIMSEPHPAKKVDPVGAGDAFDAGFLCGFLEGQSLETCGKMGNIMGAFAISVRGDMEGYRPRKELDRVLNHIEAVYR